MKVTILAPLLFLIASVSAIDMVIIEARQAPKQNQGGASGGNFNRGGGASWGRWQPKKPPPPPKPSCIEEKCNEDCKKKGDTYGTCKKDDFLPEPGPNKCRCMIIYGNKPPNINP
ncbi:hypothetical protein FKW77_001694 [Venturia effusa]|uniref:Long chronological lifespan protein 2 n=1 Tax=Venturia effusa TaxID=50376 RepID=A0A517LQP0_9PEZI|nr:hypothetical protein FKW77_001694 [Venturia effusa]